ncbi:bestrophin-like domain [Saccharopolyspora sp. NPDC002376]
MTENRQQRVAIATDDQSFNVVLLVASVLGAALMIVFPLLIGLSMRPANVAAMGLLAVTLGSTVYMSFELLHPFSGPFGVAPDSFNAAQETFQTASRPTS